MKQRFVRKPTYIEAEQFTQAHVEDYAFHECPLPIGVHLKALTCHPGNKTIGRAEFYVITIQGQEVPIKPGEWIMPEKDGVHFYPCDPEVFAATYDPAP